LKIVSLLVADIGHLKLRAQLDDFRDLLVKGVRALRARRLQAENDELIPLRDAVGSLPLSADSPQALSIERYVTVETYVLFGLAILAYYDSTHDYVPLLRDLLPGGLAPQEWERYPRNFAAYFGNERFPYALSMLFHLTYPERELPRQGKKISRKQ